MEKITALTPEQEIELSDWHAEWLGIGTCTEPADRPRAEAAITEMYSLIGEVAPTYVWVDSPATAIMAVALVSQPPDALESLDSSLELSLRSPLESSLRSSLDSSLDSSLRSSLWSSLDSSLYSSLGSSLRSSLGSSLSSLRSSLGSSLRSSLGSSLGSSRFWGQHEAYWPAFYAFCESIGVRYDPEKSRHLHLWCEISRSCGWWWPYKGLVIVSERPSEVRMELVRGGDTYRLHREDGPALAYRDGWNVYSWHGTRVPEAVIMSPETITLEQIFAEVNAEVRRVMIERIGWENFTEWANLTLLDECPDPANAPFTIRLYELPEQIYDEPVHLILVHNAAIDRDGTRRRFGITVPFSIDSALEAAAWTYGLSAQEYTGLERAS